MLAVGTRSSEIIEFNPQGVGSVVVSGHYDGELWGLAVHPSLSQFYTVGEDNLLAYWDISSRKINKVN